jgi:dephospho-CoA kinase
VSSTAQHLKIGLTGGIGSGKSTVGAILAGHGAALVDTDAIARQLSAAGGAALPALRREFGDGAIAPDGGLDRARMRQLVFADAAARRRLEAILHPLIHAQALQQATAAGGDAIVFDVPLLTESGRWRGLVDRVLVIDCRQSTQVERVSQRPGWTRESALKVIESQTSREARRSVADAVIYNDGIDLQTLQANTESLWRLWNNSRSTR